MRSKIVKIGNSMGVRIPQPLLGASGLQGDVDLRAEQGRIVITSTAQPRNGWGEAFAQAAGENDPALWPEGASLNSWDDDEWQW